MKVLTFLKNLFGFRRDSKYVRKHLNDANIRSSIYMAFIIICLEVWMIFRQARKYIRPAWNTLKVGNYEYSSHLELIFGWVGLYCLFIMCSLAMFMFGLLFILKKRGKKSFITNIVFGSLCVLWTLLLIPEINLPTYNDGTLINKVTTIMVYASMPVFGLSIIGNSLFIKFRGKDSTLLSIFAIVSFAAVCLLFGVKVGYSDFANPFVKGDGSVNIQKIKMITCFLTMITFVACLLIFKPYISIIMLTGIFVVFGMFLDNYDQREFLEADRINYITFFVSLTTITISIYHQRITEAIKDEKLIHDANYDSLTNIFNADHFVDVIVGEEKDNPAFLDDKMFLFINICNFKAINVQKGFAYGDKFLIRLAKDVAASFPKDYTARLADDHFIVLTKCDGFHDRIDVLNRLVQASSDGLFVLLKVGGYKANRGENPFRGIDKARYACGKIKKTYGQMYKEYDEELDKIFNMRQYIVNNIDEAINSGYIRPFYQPVVWSNDQTLCGVEALSRWIDPIYGMLTPKDFIPVLEETRLIHKLDRYILEYVCREMRRAIDENRPVVPVSLNLSRLDFDLMNIKEELDKRIEKYKLDKNYVHIEITESALSENTEQLNEYIKELKANGYAVWLDDFGSGYSSLNALKDFVFDVVKIDMNFLTNFGQNEKTKDIIDCIIQLSSRLGMLSLTEGVETKEEADFLSSIGCGKLQGYLFGKPFELADLEKMIYDGKLVLSDNLI